MSTTAKNTTPIYSVIQASYWMGTCITISFASVYLLSLGYTNTQLGIILAISNLIGIILGLNLSSQLDYHPNWHVTTMNSILISLSGIAQVYLFFFAEKSLLTGAIYIIAGALSVSVNPLNSKLCIDLRHNQHQLDFGVARGIGSFGFVTISMILGYLVKNISVRILPIANLVCLLIAFIANQRVRPYVVARYTISKENTSADSLSRFFLHNAYFVIAMLGVSLIYFGQNTFSNFLINDVEYLGGDTIAMGNLNAIRAFLEIPTMFMYHKLRQKYRSEQLMRFAIIFFVIKGFSNAWAPTLPLLYLVQIFNGLSYALYVSVIVDYTAEAVRYEDSAKAQTIQTSVSTLGTILASFIGGYLYDVVSVPTTLYTAASITLVGAIITLIFIRLELKTRLKRFEEVRA